MICQFNARSNNGIYLSASDVLQPPIYTSALLVFPFDLDLTDWPTYIVALKRALKKLGERYPVLTGYLTREMNLPDSDGNQGRLVVRGLGTKGPLLVEAPPIQDWVPTEQDLINGNIKGFPFQLQLMPPEEPSVTDPTIDSPFLLKVKATLCHYASRPDSQAYLILAYYLHHNVADADSFFVLLRKWGDLCRAELAERGLVPPPIQTEGVSDSSVLEQRSLLRGDPKASVEAVPNACREFVTVPNDSPVEALIRRSVASARFRISREAVNTLKRDYEGPGFCTTNDVVVAALWRAQAAITLDEDQDSDTPTTLLLPINIRGLEIGGQLIPEDYFGNALIGAAPSFVSIRALLDAPFSEVVQKIHESVKACREPTAIEQVLNWEEQRLAERRRQRGFVLPRGDARVYTNQSKYPMYQVDFGSGGPALLVSPLYLFAFGNLAWFMAPPPAAVDQGAALDIVIHMTQGQLAQMETDRIKALIPLERVGDVSEQPTWLLKPPSG